MIHEIVIARYAENVDWANEITNMNVTIYNKGKSFTSGSRSLKKKSKTPERRNRSVKKSKTPERRVLTLPNIGRETHTYLHHIIENYDRLAEMTVFSQGDPFMHSPDLLALLKHVDLFEPIQPLTLQYSPESAFNKNKIEKLPYYGVVGEDYYDKKYWIKNKRINVVYLDSAMNIVYPHYFLISWFQYYIDEYLKKIKCSNFYELIRSKYGIPLSNKFCIPFCFSAIFAVHRDLIRQHSVAFYKNLMEILLEDDKKYNFDSGFIFERLWLTIFNYQKYNPLYQELKLQDFKIKFRKLQIANQNEICVRIKTYNDILFQLDDIFNLVIGDSKITLTNVKNKVSSLKMKWNYYLFNRKKENVFRIKIEPNSGANQSSMMTVRINDVLLFNKKQIKSQIKKAEIQDVHISCVDLLSERVASK
jgi:hypothetical protein